MLFALDLSFYSVAIAWLCYFVLLALVNLNALIVAFIEILGNCLCLFSIFMNTALTWLWDVERVNSFMYILIAFVDFYLYKYSLLKFGLGGKDL